ncbi:TRM32-like protein [Drosera capensis]
MGRHADARLDDEDVARSCTWGLLHLLNHHLWRSNGVKKVLYRGRRDQGKANKRNGKPKDPKKISLRFETSDAEVKAGDYEAALRNRTKTNTINAASAKGISNKTDGVEDQTAVWSELLAKLRHLLVPRPHKAHIDSNEVPVVDSVNPSEDLSDLMPSNIAELKRCLTHKEFKENLGVIGLFNAKKLLFHPALRGADAVFLSWLFSGHKVSPEDFRLSKSASFPRFEMPSKLEHKHNEVWPVSNGKILPSTPEEKGNHQLDADSLRSNEIKILKVRRSASLTESMDHHTQLLDYSFDKEMTRRLSRSLKVRNEKEYAFAEYTPKSLRRGLSLRDHLRSSNFLPSETSRGSFSSDTPMISTFEDHKQNTVISESFSEPVGSHESAKSVEDASVLTRVEATDASPGAETMLSSDKEESCIAKEDPLPTCIDELPIQQGDLEKVIHSKSSPISKGLYSECACAPNDSTDLDTTIHSNLVKDPTMRSTSPLGYEDLLDTLESLSHINKDETLDAGDLHYVKHILELSGLLSKDRCQTRLLLEKPLDETLFEKAEANLFLKLSCSSKTVDSDDSCLRRKLLFDLIDEALLHIFDRSCTYYPKALSLMCQVRPVPTGMDVFKDVRAYISTYFSLRPVSDPWLDGAAAHDLSKNKGWMSLQHDSESVALQLEDLIFNELLAEVLG